MLISQNVNSGLKRNRDERLQSGPVLRDRVEELDHIFGVLLEERHKLPRRTVLTRWLSSTEAARIVLNKLSRRAYIKQLLTRTTDLPITFWNNWLPWEGTVYTVP